MYDLTQINRDFFIRHYPSLEGHGVNSLISSQMLYDILGEELAEDTIRRAYEEGADLYDRQFRRGIKIEFYTR